MGCESILSFDCAWWHKRNSHQCFSAIFDIITEKIVGWNATENKLIPSQQFEGEMLTSMKYIYEDKRVKWHIKNGNLVTFNLITMGNETTLIFLDPNHIKGKFSRILDKFDEKGWHCFGFIKTKLTSFSINFYMIKY